MVNGEVLYFKATNIGKEWILSFSFKFVLGRGVRFHAIIVEPDSQEAPPLRPYQV